MRLLILSKSKALHMPRGKIEHADACYFLSDDYKSLVRLRSTHGNDSISSLGDAFHAKIKTIEKDFLSFSHRINMANKSDYFWGTHLASRNSGSTSLLKWVAYFECAMDIIDQGAAELVLICDSPALCEVLAQKAARLGISCKLSATIKDRIYPIFCYVRVAVGVIVFFIFSILQRLYSIRLKNERLSTERQSSTKRYLIRSWMTKGNIDENGRYSDRNFGELLEYLRKNCVEVWILPMFFNLDRSLFSQFDLMARSRTFFLITWQYLTVDDLFHAMMSGVKATRLKNAAIDYKGVDFSSIIREAHLTKSASPSLMELNTVRYLIKKLAGKGIHFDKFLFPIENNAPEKLFILSVRKYYPQSEIVGFQHTVVFKEQLGFCLGSEELPYYPVPDKIVCGGKRYLDLLTQLGFPCRLLRLGPSLRFRDGLTRFKWKKPSDQSAKIKILIVLNYDDNQNYEAIEKCRLTAGMLAMPSIIYIKPHPVNNLGDLKRYLRTIMFPPYTLVDGSVGEWLIKSSVVLMAGGSISNIEAVITGIPLVRISLDNNFDFDSLWDQYPLSSFLSNPDQIAASVKHAFNISKEEQKALRSFSEKILANYFEPITDEQMRVFL